MHAHREPDEELSGTVRYSKLQTDVAQSAGTPRHKKKTGGNTYFSKYDTFSELRRDMARLRFVMDQIKEVEEARAQRLEQVPQEKTHAMVRPIARVIGVGIETADMLVHEILSRQLRDRRAVARYAGLTGAPDESGNKRRETGLSAKAGNARVRRGMIQLAWRFLVFQKDSALARWYRTRTESAGRKCKTMIVALARKLLIALWRLVTIGEVPAGVVLRAA